MKIELAERCLNKELEGLEMLRQVIHSEEYLKILNHLSAYTDYSRRIIITGVGKNSNIAEKSAATFASLGIPVQSLNTSHCPHGDYGSIGPNDTIIHISRSGNTKEMLEVIHHVSGNYPNVVQILIHCNSKKKPSECQYELWLGDVQEGDEFGLAPTSTTTTILCLLDTLAVVLSNAIGFKPLDFFKYHPGGSLGAAFKDKVGFIYKTTNLINSRFYVGQCQNDPREKYLGSGKLLEAAIKKYGSENFRREILQYATQEDLDDLEKQWITRLDAMNKEAGGYNLQPGGQGGWTHVNDSNIPNGMLGKKHKVSSKEQMSITRRTRKIGVGESNLFYGKKHQLEALKKMSQPRPMAASSKAKRVLGPDGTIYKSMTATGISKKKLAKHLIDPTSGWKTL